MEAYTYIGSDLHNGHCPACKKHCVPPAGKLLVQGQTTWQSPNGLGRLWVYTYDERGRPFEFEVSVLNTVGKLTGIKMDGIQVDPNRFVSLLGLPEVIVEEITAAGVTEIQEPDKAYSNRSKDRSA